MKLTLALASLILTHAISAQSAGTFGPTGSMTIPRVWQTATLLTNGKVLIAGGVQTITNQNGDYLNQVTATAELYDPATGAFTPTGSMSMGRYWHAATLLADGRVLISGGQNQTQTTNTAEIYDPATGSFSLTAPMMYSHACQQAVLLNSSQVLVVGGSDANGTGDSHPELFTPHTASFSSAGSLSVQGNNTCAGEVGAVLTNGKVLLVSEYGTAQIYDPAMQIFTPTGAPAENFSDGLPTATLLADGTVLVAGGYWDGGINNTAFTFDETSGLFTRTGNMSTGYDAHTATLLPDGGVLLAGTCSEGISPASDAIGLLRLCRECEHSRQCEYMPDGFRGMIPIISDILQRSERSTALRGQLTRRPAPTRVAGRLLLNVASHAHAVFTSLADNPRPELTAAPMGATISLRAVVAY